MIELNKKENCCGCSACEQICPVHAIHMVEDNEGFLYPVVAQDRCVGCNRCNITCPNKGTTVSKSEITGKIYAAYRNCLESRMKSASGGIFAVIAEWVISQHGIVYGAAYQTDFSVAHIRVEEQEKLERLLGSKYVQSNLRDTFQLVKRDIQTGKKILFCGTPCQVAGLKNYLNAEYENLILVDFICHGVPSPKVWMRYLNEIAHGRKIKRIVPRDKAKGIVNCPMAVYFEDGTIFNQKYERNEYLRGFAANLFLRPSCYECRQKGLTRCSDITLADFWGIEKEKPTFGDNYGISAVIIHSRKAQQIINYIGHELIMEEASFSQFIPYNPCAVSSPSISPSREHFFEFFPIKGVSKSVSSLLGSVTLLKLRKQLLELKFLLLVCIKKMSLRMGRK